MGYYRQLLEDYIQEKWGKDMLAKDYVAASRFSPMKSKLNDIGRAAKSSGTDSKSWNKFHKNTKLNKKDWSHFRAKDLTKKKRLGK